MTNLVEISIVPAVPDQARQIGELRADNRCQQYARCVDEAWLADEYARMTSPKATANREAYIAQAQKDGAQNLWLVAQVIGAGVLAGYAEASKNSGKGRDEQELHSIHLREAYRGQHIGARLLEAVHTWFDPGKPAFLDVAGSNGAAQRFYASHGYAQVSAYDYKGLPMVRMQRDV